ncbi:MAG: hypothetical protein R3B59_04385 [Dehalococcoidia bacterium]
MTPPRPRKNPQDLDAVELIPEDEFADAMKAIFRAPRAKVLEQVEELRKRERNDDAHVS